jgi:molybdate transport system substrate-binding protein
MTRRPLAALLLPLALALCACGSSHDTGGAGGAQRPALRVSAAASLKSALTGYGSAFPAADPRFSFAGSDVLAAQIRSGARPDVFAAANAKLPDQLAAEGLVEPPVAFARNRLVIATPADETAIGSIDDLAGGGVRLAIGAASVPVGSYTRAVLDRLPPASRAAVMGNVRSEEPDVSGIVGKLTQGAVTAGLVYASDVTTSGGRLRAVALPERLQPEVVYKAAVVKGTAHPAEARAFVAGLLGDAGQDALRQAGLLPPP